MAVYGIEYPVFAKITAESANEAPTYDTGHVIGALMKADISLTRASGEMYGDNVLIEAANDATGGTITLQVDELSSDALTGMVGYTGTESDGYKVYSESTPRVGFGYIRNTVHRGKQSAWAVWYPAVQFSLGNESYSTKAESTTFTGETVEGRIFPMVVDETNKPLVNEIKKFETVTAAKEWLDGKAGIS